MTYSEKVAAENHAERVLSERNNNPSKESYKRCNDLADRLRETYGFSDSDAEYIISRYDLDRKY